jgi:hypothetical protein
MKPQTTEAPVGAANNASSAAAHSAWRPIALAVVGTTIVLLFAGQIFSGSVDFAHHYALTAYLYEHLRLPALNDPALLSMAYYPPATHAIAAFIGRLLGSPLLGLHVVSLLSQFVLWAGFGVWLSTLPHRALPWLTAFLALLVLIGHYFYSQLVAQAAAIAVLAFAATRARAGWSAVQLGWLLALAAPVVASLHLLPGLFLVGTLGASGCIYLIAHRRPLFSGLVRVGILTAFSLGLIIVNPAFSAMRKLSDDNGSLPLNFVADMPHLLALAVFTGLSSAALSYCWIRQQRMGHGRAYVAVALLAAYGLAVSVLCIAQALALAIGQGSEYAVRKYAFSLQVAVLLQIATLVAVVVATRFGRATKGSVTSQGWAAVLPAGLSGAVILPMFWVVPPVVDTSRLLATEAALTTYRRLSPTQTAVKSSYVVDLDGVPNTFGFMFSTGVLRSPATPNGFDVLRGAPFAESDRIDRIFTSTGSRWDTPRCRLAGNSDGIAVIDAQCALRETVPCDGTLDFTSGGRVPVAVLSGFGAPWAQGRWAEASTASIVCVATGRTTARIAAFGFVTRDHAQRLAVSVAGRTVLQTRFEKERQFQELTLVLPADCGEDCKIQFAMPDATSPAALGVSADTSTLGIGIRSITFTRDERAP